MEGPSCFDAVARELPSPSNRLVFVVRPRHRRAVVVDESLGGDNFLFIRRPLLTDGDVAAYPCFQGGDVAKKLSEREIGSPKFDKVLNDLR